MEVYAASLLSESVERESSERCKLNLPDSKHPLNWIVRRLANWNLVKIKKHYLEIAFSVFMCVHFVLLQKPVESSGKGRFNVFRCLSGLKGAWTCYLSLLSNRYPTLQIRNFHNCQRCFTNRSDNAADNFLLSLNLIFRQLSLADWCLSLANVTR